MQIWAVDVGRAKVNYSIQRRLRFGAPLLEGGKHRRVRFFRRMVWPGDAGFEFFTRAVRARARGFIFGSEWSPHLSRGVSTTDQNSLEPSICKGASIRSPLLTTCRGYARPKLRTLCHTRVKTRTLRRQVGPSVKNSNPSVLPSCQKCSGSPATKKHFF